MPPRSPQRIAALLLACVPALVAVGCSDGATSTGLSEDAAPPIPLLAVTGEPLTPVPGDRILVNGAGLQAASSLPTALASLGETTVDESWRLFLSTDIDGLGTNAFRLEWPYGNSSCAFFSTTIQVQLASPLPKRMFVQWKQHMGRTPTGGGGGLIGGFLLTDHGCATGRTLWSLVRSDDDVAGRIDYEWTPASPVIPFITVRGAAPLRLDALATEAANIEQYIGRTATHTLFVEAASAPGAADGTIRLWIDGVLVVDRRGLALDAAAFRRLDLPGLTPRSKPRQTEYFHDIVVWEPSAGPPPDVTPPSVPQGVTASVQGPTLVRVAWTGSTDETGVTEYRVFRDGAQIGTTSGTTYDDATADDATTYSYTVAAVDGAGNVSAQSAAAGVTTPDGTAPTAPTGLQTTVLSATTVRLNWTAASDNVGVTGYRILRDGVQVATPTATSYEDSGLEPAHPYSYTVVAVDAAANVSAPSNAASVTTLDNVAPTAPTQITATATGETTANIVWSGAIDNVAVTRYRVLRDGAQVGETTVAQFADQGLLPARTYAWRIVALDAAGNASPPSAPASATTPDATAPSAPQSLTATPSGSTVALAWLAASDNVGVATYEVLRNGAAIGTTTTLTFTDGGIVQGVTYTYSVRALDAAGNRSPPSNVVTVAIADATPPSAPTGLVATAQGESQANLSWTASGDNVGVTSYRVVRDGTAIATATATSFTDLGVTAAKTYSYVVHALDAAGNVSQASAPATVTTPDLTPPLQPTNLQAVAPSQTLVRLTWTAPTDNVAVVSYRVLRQGVVVGTSPAATFDDAGVVAGTSYSYTVVALDAAGNASPPSAEVAVTTPPSTADVTPPLMPTGVAVGLVGPTHARVTWDHPTPDNVGVVAYRVMRNSQNFATVPAPPFDDASLLEGPTYRYAIIALDAAGNASPQSVSVPVTTPDPYPPEAPTNLQATIQGTLVKLTWTAAVDNFAIGHYRVFRDGVLVGQPGTPAYNDANAAPQTTYTYTVQAFDPQGNSSGLSAPLTVTTATSAPGSALPARMPPSTGAVFYVSPSGSDANPGTLVAPWRNIQKALDVLLPGQTVLVRAGTYREALVWRRTGATNAPVTLAAYPGEAPVLDGEHVRRPLTITYAGAHFRIRGFTIVRDCCTSGGAIDVYGQNVEIVDNEMRDGRGKGVYFSSQSRNVHVVGNWVHHNGTAGGEQDHGLYVQGVDHLVANNVIHDQFDGFGIQIYPGASRVFVVNNTVTHNGQSGIVVGGSSIAHDITIRNNIIAFNHFYGVANRGCPTNLDNVQVQNNLIYGNPSGAAQTLLCLPTSLIVSDNIHEDPLFVNAGDAIVRNLRLLLGSPAINASRLDSAMPIAIGNVQRDAIPDLGAYEHGPPP